MQVVLAGGSDKFEQKIAAEIVEGISEKSVLNLTGKLSLKELGALINMSSAVVCTDSLAFHMSSVFKKNCVALFGPTSEKKWGAWHNDNARIITKNYSCRPCLMNGCGGSRRSECLYDITEDEVLSKVKEFII